MRLILIRHAQTPANVAYTMHTTIPGPELTALGRQQAAALPAALADEKIDALYASTHQRTELIAAPLAAACGLRVHVRGGIREVSAGHWEGASDRASHTSFLDLVFGWPTDPTTRVPGGESGQEMLQRFDDVIDEAVKQRGRHVVELALRHIPQGEVGGAGGEPDADRDPVADHGHGRGLLCGAYLRT